MRRLSKAGIGVIVVLALGAVVASAASAAAPEYGRCLLKASPVGEGFTNSSCTNSTASNAHYEWIPGPGLDPGFTLAEKSVYSAKYRRCQKALFEEELAKKERSEAAEETIPPERKAELIEKAEGHENAAKLAYEQTKLDKNECESLVEAESAKAPAVIQVEGHSKASMKVTCGEVSGAGEYSGAKGVANLTITFAECALKGVVCQSSLVGEGEIETSTLSVELGIIKTKEGVIKSVGLAISPAEGVPFAEFSCGESTFAVTGSAIREVKSNKMEYIETKGFSQKNGKQKPEEFFGQIPDVLETSINGGPDIQTGLGLKAVQENDGGEKIEVNTSV